MSEEEGKGETGGISRSIRSGIPGLGDSGGVASDSYTSRESFKAFNQRGRYIGAYEGYGAKIRDTDRLFYSTREPVGVWWVKHIAYDIFDNGFHVVNPDDVDDKTLDRDVQRLFHQLKAKQALIRSTVFERRYGTSILVHSYTGFGDNVDWGTPLFELEPDGSFPDNLNAGELLQVTPYPWTSVNVDELDLDESSIRYGLPLYYKIHIGSASSDTVVPSGEQADNTVKVHWTRVTLDNPRLDEHPYEGIPAIDAIFDDLVGGRNARWGAYESYYRHGTGFPVIKTRGTPEQNREWIENGGLNDYVNVRGYFVCHIDEEFSFEGAQGRALNPNTYFDMYYTFIAAATGVAKDSIQGVSAGRVTGSEVNERQYYKSISLLQNQKEPVIRELVDRLIQTGQIEYEGDYVIDWVDPFEVNPQDKAAIEFMETRTRALQTWKTFNELRAEEGLEPIEGGDVLMSLPGQMAPGGSEPAPNQEEPAATSSEPEEGSPSESTLLDKVLGKALDALGKE